jgi:anti-anti-sigma factor
VVVQVVGRGSFKTSPALKAFIRQATDKADCQRFIFDMQECVSMDSTFMGVVAGLAIRMKKSGHDGLIIINLTPKTYALLDTLGVCRLLDAYATENTPPELQETVKGTTGFVTLGDGAADRLSSVETMLAAHEDLVQASPDNKERFQDVIGYLSKDAEELRAAEGSQQQDD